MFASLVGEAVIVDGTSRQLAPLLRRAASDALAIVAPSARGDSGMTEEEVLTIKLESVSVGHRQLPLELTEIAHSQRQLSTVVNHVKNGTAAFCNELVAREWHNAVSEDQDGEGDGGGRSPDSPSRPTSPPRGTSRASSGSATATVGTASPFALPAVLRAFRNQYARESVCAPIVSPDMVEVRGLLSGCIEVHVVLRLPRGDPADNQPEARRALRRVLDAVLHAVAGAPHADLARHLSLTSETLFSQPLQSRTDETTQAEAASPLTDACSALGDESSAQWESMTPELALRCSFSQDVVHPYQVQARAIANHLGVEHGGRATLCSEALLHDALELLVETNDVGALCSILAAAPQYALLTRKDGTSLLHHAAASAPGPAVLRALLACGARIDDYNDCGQTPLHVAVVSAHPAAVLALLDHADVTAAQPAAAANGNRTAAANANRTTASSSNRAGPPRLSHCCDDATQHLRSPGVLEWAAS